MVRHKKLLSLGFVILLLTMLAMLGWSWFSKPDTNPEVTAPPPKPSFNKQLYSTTTANSIWVVVNKHLPLQPVNYAPTSLVVPNIPLRSNITSTEKQVSQVMEGPLEAVVAAAQKAGINLNLQSGYRSYAFQVSLYNRYVQQEGVENTDTQSARPGYSEHQTGLAVDLGGTSTPSCNVEQCFANTSEGKWLAANSYKYGFIVRYPEGKDAITGYEYEPWHLRYVGAALATQMHHEGVQTLEEFFGVTGGVTYK